jgi:hypothetical protein
MGRVIGKIFKPISKIATSVLGGGLPGMILGGIGKAFGGGGIGALANPINMFSKIAGGIMGKLGSLGLSALPKPPTRMGIAPMRYMHPHLHVHLHGAPKPGGPSAAGGGPQLTGTESKLINRFGGLEKQMNGLLDKLNKGDKLSQAELTKIQTQLTKISNMMKQITSILNQIQDTMKSIIQNIRA